MEQSATSEVRARGEITIPKKIRKEFDLETGQAMTFIPFGRSAVLMTPKRLELEEARRLILNILKQTLSEAEDVLEGLEVSREEVFQKHYGKKIHGKRR